MPIYEFKCDQCYAKFELLLAINEPALCPKCGSTTPQKLVSRFRRIRSEDDRIDHIADHLEAMAEPESTHQMREFIKEMGRATDDDMSDELEEMFETDLENPNLND
jgi:putative FmdB family regulatory protein